MARPSPEMIGLMIGEIANGASLRSMLTKYELDAADFKRYLDSDFEASQRYDSAVSIRTDLLVDDTLTIADNLEIDIYRANTQIKTRQWIASKMNPQKYGDRLDVSINRTVDIGGALKEAKARALSQPIDVTPITTGLEPVAQLVAPQNDTEDDIFS